MNVSIAAERCNEDGAVIKKCQPCRQGQQPGCLSKKPKGDIAGMDDKSDPEDGDFLSDGLLAESLEEGDTEVDEAQPSNAEVCAYMICQCSYLSSLRVTCIDCRYTPFENHSNDWTGFKKAKEEQSYCWSQGQLTSTIPGCNWELIQ